MPYYSAYMTLGPTGKPFLVFGAGSEPGYYYQANAIYTLSCNAMDCR
jgi:hypothetical protein